MSLKKVSAASSSPASESSARLRASDARGAYGAGSRGFHDPGAGDGSLQAMEVLLSAQERMKGLVEAASALNKLMAEAADKNNMPFPLPALPPNLSAQLAQGLGRVASLARQVRDPELSRPQPPPGAGTPSARLEGVIKSRGFITNEDVRNELGLTPAQATMRLKQWVADRVVVQRGQRRGARYVAGVRWPPPA